MENGPNMTKYGMLQTANGNTNLAFQNYEQECLHFIRVLGYKFSNYLEAPQGMVTFGIIPNSVLDNETIIEPNEIVKTSFNKLMVLLKDSYYVFSISIKLTPDNILPQEIIAIILFVKKKDDKFIVKYNNQEFPVELDKQDDINVLFDCVFAGLEKYLSTGFEKFITGRPSATLGFINLSSSK